MRRTDAPRSTSERVFVREPYAARSIRFLELWEPGEWRIKVYGITYRGPGPQPALVATAKEVARELLLRAASQEGHYGVGFMGIHEGRGANLVFMDWWAAENELHHHVYLSSPQDPTALEYVTPTGLAACVWDLAVIAFERQAWIDTVLTDPRQSDLEPYLACRFEGAA